MISGKTGIESEAPFLEDDSQGITKGKNGTLIKFGPWFSRKSSNCLINHREPTQGMATVSRAICQQVPMGGSYASYFPCCNHILSDSKQSWGSCDRHLYEPVNGAEFMSPKSLAHRDLGSHVGYGRAESKALPFCPLGYESFVSGMVEGTSGSEREKIVFEATNIYKYSNSHKNAIFCFFFKSPCYLYSLL